MFRAGKGAELCAILFFPSSSSGPARKKEGGRLGQRQDSRGGGGGNLDSRTFENEKEQKKVRHDGTEMEERRFFRSWEGGLFCVCVFRAAPPRGRVTWGWEKARMGDQTQGVQTSDISAMDIDVGEKKGGEDDCERGAGCHEEFCCHHDFGFRAGRDFVHSFFSALPGPA